ncbi:hypothetical protein FB451DRAFT_584802 [Mycena latifolia]|nr:hypothetical protein FB451DRAFT_584802 [Mycena latifolia]
MVLSSALSLSGLPVEVLGIILEFATASTLVSLCQTNQRIHAACLRYIYRTVELVSLTSIVKCCQTFIANTSYALEVRTFKLVCYPTNTFRCFAYLIQSAMAHLINVEDLILQVSPPLISALKLSSFHFPRLRTCKMPCATHTASFLRRHLTIVFLAGLQAPEGDSLYMLPELRIHMPALRSFAGSPTLACTVVPYSRVWRVLLWWPLQNMPAPNYADVIDTLALSETKILRFDNVVDTWDVALLVAIVAGMPDLTDLSIRNDSVSDPTQLEIFIAHLDTVVAGLPHLSSLSISQDLVRGADFLDPRDLEVEFDAVRRWGDISYAPHRRSPQRNVLGALTPERVVSRDQSAEYAAHAGARQVAPRPCGLLSRTLRGVHQDCGSRGGEGHCRPAAQCAGTPWPNSRVRDRHGCGGHGNVIPSRLSAACSDLKLPSVCSYLVSFSRNQFSLPM